MLVHQSSQRWRRAQAHPIGPFKAGGRIIWIQLTEIEDARRLPGHSQRISVTSRRALRKR